MIEIVTSWDDFREKWTGGEKRQNFLLRGEMFPYTFTPPPLEQVIDEVRANERTRFLRARADGSLSSEHVPAFRTLPLEQALRETVTVAHFDVREFSGPGQVFEGLNHIFDQWYESLSAHGFTWSEEQAQRAFFYSPPHCSTGYHFDSSYVLVCQVEGRKRFCWLKEPERWCSREELQRCADNYGLMTRPEGITPDDVIECEMGPGDVLWNVLLTPHWVYAVDKPTYSFNLTHFDLRYEGALSPMDEELHEIRRERAREHQAAAAGV